MKRILLTAFVALTYIYNATGQNAVNTISLQSAIDIALQNNIPVKQKELEVETAQKNYRQAKFNRLPGISGDLNYGVNNGRSIDPFTNTYSNQQLSSSNGSLTAELPIFRGFQTQNSIKQNRFTYEAVRAETQQEKDNLVLNVILAYLQVLNNEDVLALNKIRAEVTQKQVERLELLNREGAIAPALLSDMQGQLATDNIAIVDAANALETSKLALAQLMNTAYSKEMQLDRAGMDTSIQNYTSGPNQIYDSALQKLSIVKAADLRYKAASSAIKVAAAAHYPTLSLFGQLNSNYSSAARTFTATTISNVPSGDYVTIGGSDIPVMTKQSNFNDQRITYFNQLNKNLNTYVGVSLSIPLFNRFQTNTNVSLARINARNAALVAENTRMELRQSIDQAYLDMTSANDRYKLLQEQVIAFRESFRSAEIKFESGVINSVEYLIVKNNLDRAMNNLTVARYESLLRSKVLDFYQGK